MRTGCRTRTVCLHRCKQLPLQPGSQKTLPDVAGGLNGKRFLQVSQWGAWPQAEEEMSTGHGLSFPPTRCRVSEKRVCLIHLCSPHSDHGHSNLPSLETQ